MGRTGVSSLASTQTGCCAAGSPERLVRVGGARELGIQTAEPNTVERIDHLERNCSLTRSLYSMVVLDETPCPSC